MPFEKEEVIHMGNKPKGVVLEPTMAETLLSFACACVFGLLCLPSLFELKDLIPLILSAAIPLKYATRAYIIFTTIILGILWLVLFFLLWNRLEKSQGHKARLLKTLRWSAIAVAVFVLSIGGHVLFDMIMVA